MPAGYLAGMQPVANPFITPRAAQRYVEFRPDFADHLASILERHIGRVATAVDVGAGTGISTRAVARLARTTAAADASPEMAAAGGRASAACWVVASAERLPFRDAAFELVVVGSALHWFHREAFAAEAARVTRSNAYLVVHDHGFTGVMDDVPGFTGWMHHRYRRGYPAPPRGEKLAPGDDVGPFRFEATHRYDQAVTVTRASLAGYLTTQSNLQVVMTSPRAEARILQWLEQDLDPYFQDTPTRVVHFAGIASVLRRRT
jgi:SAM-dependent methyltransferase